MHLYDGIAEELGPEGGGASRFPWVLFFLVSFLSHLCLLLILQQWGRWERSAAAPDDPMVQLVGPEALAPPLPKPRELLFGTDQEKDLRSIPKGKETRLPPIPKSERPGLPATPRGERAPDAALRPAPPPAPPAPVAPSAPAPPPSLPITPEQSESLPAAPPSAPPSAESSEIKKSAPLPSLPEGEEGRTAPIRPNGLPGLPFADAKSLDRLAKVFSDQERTPRDAISLNTEDFKYLSYNMSVSNRIQLIGKYPEAAGGRGLHGDVFLYFTIQKDGYVSDIQIVSTSGYDVFDQEAVRTIKSASPFPPLPESWNQDKVTIGVHFIFINNYTYLR